MPERQNSSAGETSRLAWRYGGNRIGVWCCALLVALMTASGALERVELATEDARLALFPLSPHRSPIVLVTVGPETYRAWPEPTAFWGARFAALIRTLDSYGPKVIALDYVLAAPADDYIERELERALPALRLDSDRAEKWLDTLPAELRPNQTLFLALEQAHTPIVLADAPNLHDNTLLNTLRNGLDSSRGCLASAQVHVDADGVVRSLPLYATDQNDMIQPGFAARIAAFARHIAPEDVSGLRRLAHLPETALTNREEAYVRIAYAGDANDAFHRLSAAEITAGNALPLYKDKLHDAIVIVGTAQYGAADKHFGPNRRMYDGVQIQAQAVATLLENRAPLRLSREAETLLALLFCGITAALAARRSLNTEWLWMLGSLVFWSAVCIGFFVRAGRVLPMTGPLLGLIVPFVVGHLVRSVEEAQRRLKVERLFGRSVSPDIMNYLLHHPEQLALTGKQAEATVLFFDVRGFSRFAAVHTPEEAFAALNRLFARVAPIVEAHGGLVYRYLGDGLLAVFGIPGPLPNHAQSAMDAASAMVRAVNEGNAHRSEMESWQVGCGVHSGTLAYGNLGVAERSEFTVIGDVVNLASRLEGLNKPLRSEIVLSAETWERLGTRPVCSGPIQQKVDGRQEPVSVYYI